MMSGHIMVINVTFWRRLRGNTLMHWAERQGIRLEHVQPGKPQQNAYIERYNRTVRYDWLSHCLFESIGEVQDYATDWMWTHNHERPNMALSGITPETKAGFNQLYF